MCAFNLHTIAQFDGAVPLTLAEWDRQSRSHLRKVQRARIRLRLARTRGWRLRCSPVMPCVSEVPGNADECVTLRLRIIPADVEFD